MYKIVNCLFKQNFQTNGGLLVTTEITAAMTNYSVDIETEPTEKLSATNFYYVCHNL